MALVAWLCVPSRSAPESADSTLAFPDGVEPWATSSGKPSLRRSSWRGWKTRPWIARLSGRIWSASRLARFEARWTSWWRAFPARRSPAPASAGAPTTSATSGLSSALPLLEHAPRSRSWRMSGALFDIQTGSGGGCPTLPDSGSMRSGRLCERPMSALRTSEPESSCWPTATSKDSASSGAAAYSTESGRHSGTTLTDAARNWHTPSTNPQAPGTNRADGIGSLEEQARLWSTPDASVANDQEDPASFVARQRREKAKGRNGNGMGTPLAMQAKLWATPTSHERTHSPRVVDHGEQLANQAAMWATPQAHDVQSPKKIGRAHV